jgi:hypothetical protein
VAAAIIREIAAMDSLPLNLSILRMVQEFKKIPLGLLYDKLSASNSEIDKQVAELATKGAIKVKDEEVTLGDL